MPRDQASAIQGDAFEVTADSAGGCTFSIAAFGEPLTFIRVPFVTTMELREFFNQAVGQSPPVNRAVRSGGAPRRQEMFTADSD
jgi:hypothetical protein